MSSQAARRAWSADVGVRRPGLRPDQTAGHGVLDYGAETVLPGDDYPDYAERVARALTERRAQRGILLCGSGVGASVAANKFTGIRAALCHDTFSARQGVED